MKKVLFFAAALCLTAGSSAYAVDTDGRLGIGATFSRSVNVSYGLSGGKVISGGFSFANYGARVDGGDSATDFAFGADFMMPLVMGDMATLYFDAGLEVAILDTGSSGFGLSQDGDDSTTLIAPHVGLTGRVFIGNNFSVEASHGLVLENISPPGDGDSFTDISTFSDNITSMRFVFWLDAQ